jgi:hypothetical protein
MGCLNTARVCFRDASLSGSGCSLPGFYIVCGGILHRQSLHGRSILHEWTQLVCYLAKQPVIVVFYVSPGVPQCHAAELSRGWVQRLDIFNEAGEGLDTRKELVIERSLEFVDFGRIDSAVDYSGNMGRNLLKRLWLAAVTN